MIENIAGKSTRQLAEMRRTARWVLVGGGFFCLGLILVELLRGYQTRDVFLPLICFFALFGVDKVFNAALDHVMRRENDAVQGAEAEEAVAAILSQIRDCVVVHDIMAAAGNIDHLVFRKDGAVFLLETKSHRGPITEERAGQFLHQTHRNIYWFRDFLKARLGADVWLNAAIVFPNGNVQVRRPLRGVEIVSSQYLKPWIARTAGNPQIASKLWSERDRITADLKKA
jgi:hypothetical protein